MSKFIEIESMLQKTLVNIEYIVKVESDAKGERSTIIMSDGKPLIIDSQQAEQIRSRIVAKLLL